MWFGRHGQRIHIDALFGLDGINTDTAWSGPAIVSDSRLAESLIELGLEIVHEVRGPMRLWDFASRLERRLGMPRVGTGVLSEALKAALERIDDPRLGVLATSMPGVGYVYDTRDPDSHPVRASR